MFASAIPVLADLKSSSTQARLLGAQISLRVTLLVLLVLSLSASAQTEPAAAPTPAAGGDISGVVKSGTVPLPGVTIFAANTLTGQKVITSTAEDGRYALHVSANGRYVVRAEMAAFAATTHEVVINAQNRSGRADFDLVLLSRAQQQEQTAAVQQQHQAATGPSRGFQSLSVIQSELGAGSENGFNGGEQGLPAGLQVPGMSPESATESVSITGNTANAGWSGLSSEEIRQRVQEMRERQGGLFDSGGAGGFGSGPGGGRGPGGFGGGGGGPFMLGGGRGRFNFDRPHGSIYYRVGDSALDASPFSLTGIPQAKPSYQQNNFGGSLGGPVNIPKIYNGGQKMFFFVNYNGARAENPYDAFATVPTDGSFSTINERAGNFSGLPAIYDPCTGLPFVNNVIPNATNPCTNKPYLDPVAQALLNYIPLPNLPGTVKNFHFITTATSNSDDLNVRVVRAFGKSTLRQQRRGGPGGGGRNNLNVGFHYHSTETNLTNPFPSVGGTAAVRSFDIPVGYVRSFGKLTNNLRFDFNRNRIRTQNLYAFNTNVAGIAGVNGVSPNPFDYGIPNLGFSDLSSLNDINPLLRRDQTFTFSDTMIWSHGKHTWRWGGDFRRIQLNTETASNPRGSFTFTGVNTAQIINGVATPGTGFDFADFLLGLPQLTSLQFGANNYHFRGNSWDLFVQDEWRMRGNLTLNLGLRYEYVSPYTEINNLIANLMITSLSFNSISVNRVLPGTPGVPATLVHPDRSGFAPRIGLAWKPFAKTVVRAGYGINYNTSAYSTIVQQLAFQPPFTMVQTNRECFSGQPCTSLVPNPTLANGFASSVPPSTVTNNYGVNPNYRMGYVQIWNLNIQRELKGDVLVNVDYTGTKGTHLDVLEAPNRNTTGTGLLNGEVPVFNFQTSQADSILHSGSLRVRKRLRHGVSIGGSYTYSKSIDDASTIGGGTTVVAQNAFNLAAERGLSSFDQRHRFVADYLVELPFGHDKRWLASKSLARDLFGDWQWSGDWTIASGLPFSPQVIGSFGEVNSGVNGTLRPNLTGQPIALPNPSVLEWFNTTAFAVPPAGGFGDAGRNSIEGPGTLLFDMAFTKVVPLGDVRVLELRAQMTNIFNTPQFTGIDTNVNSPTFGQVISVGSMRKIQMQARFRF
ncbi:MAG TPA: TonB-dependent receptor [Terriglobales bacterium]|nr:TonB-dependent receptor [Terriglobales bacterium]